MKKIFAPLLLLSILLSACNLPGPQPPLSIDDQAATLVAKTLTAVALEVPTEENLVPLATPSAENPTPLVTPTLENVPTLQPNVTSTGTSTAALLTVDSNTNCREGPGTGYAIVIQLAPGVNYQMIARTADNKYWIVTEIGKSTPCWIPAEMSNAFGNTNLLPVTTPSAPTSSAGTLQPPGSLTYRYSCAYNGVNSDITVNLSWSDRSNNEEGFRVYRDGALVATLPANTTVYTDLFAGSASFTYSYRIAAFNAAGEALGGTISFSCSG